MILLLMLFSSQAWAFSSIDCTSNQKISYSNHNLLGGVPPIPGMISDIEEIIDQGNVIYRVVTRVPCDPRDPHCVLERPELKDIVPPNFSFKFDPSTKKILETRGTHRDPIYEETYAIRFHLVSDLWMLCDFSFILAP